MARWRPSRTKASGSTRESRERNTTGYVVKTDRDTDLRIIGHYQQQINAKSTKPRPDLAARLGYRNSHTYQIENYNAAPFPGMRERSTCVTKSAEGCAAGGTAGLLAAQKALDELQPKDIEENLEELFAQPGSPLSERDFYPQGAPNKPQITTNAQQSKKPKSALASERQRRKKAWEKP